MGQTCVPFGPCVLWLSYVEASVPNEVVSGMRLSALAFPSPISYVKWPADSSCIASGRSFSTSPREGAREDWSYSFVGTLVFTDTVPPTSLHRLRFGEPSAHQISNDSQPSPLLSAVWGAACQVHSLETLSLLGLHTSHPLNSPLSSELFPLNP